MRLCTPNLVLVALVSWMAVAVSGSESHPVRARLLADVAAVQPGLPLRLGIELRMAEGWHTYWVFSGDAGMPTRVVWDLPPGFQAGALQWPLPEKYEEAGGLIAYGYADSTLLLAEIATPSDLQVGDLVRFGAKVSWLTCREVCIPGDTLLVLELPVAREKRRVEEELFARYAARIPGPLEPAVKWNYEVQRLAGELWIELELEAPEIETGTEDFDFYPLAAEDFAFRSTRILGSRSPRLRLILRPYGEEKIASLKGILVYRPKGKPERRAGEVELVLGGRRWGSEKRGGDLGQGDRSTAEPAFLGYLSLAVLGGMILNLMPCVLPVISLKILGLLSQAGEERRRVRELGLAFCAGIVTAFLLLAAGVLLLKRGGEQIGWGFQFQYPGFVISMAALVFALGLSLFGVFSIDLTAGGMHRLANREGVLGSFGNGVLATVLATPCTAPFLGTAIGFALSQPGATVLGIFAAVGLGMALPYALLAFEPGWMRFLPRPGAWTEHFKQLMGFLLMGTVLWLLWVLGYQVGVEGVIWTGAFLLCVGLASWLIGQWVDLHSSQRKRWIARALALAVLLGGYQFFLAPVFEFEDSLAATPATEEWQPFTRAELDRLLAAGDRHVFIDFTAEWCWTCKVNERTVLANSEVQKRLAELDVALLKADWTNRNPEIAALLRAFGRSGVPLYVIFPAGHPDRPLVLPEVLTSERVFEKLEEAEAIRRGSK